MRCTHASAPYDPEHAVALREAAGVLRRNAPRWIACLVLACLASSTRAQDPIAADRRNVVLIVVDDLGYADLGCQGSAYYRTPNIDRLAAGGARFTDAYAAAAICSPSRAAILTGRYPCRSGVTDWIRPGHQGAEPGAGRSDPSGFLQPEGCDLCVPENASRMALAERTLAEVLRDAGYATGFIGKWHLGGDDHYPEHQGFDVNLGGCDYGQPPSYFDPYANATLDGIPTLAPRSAGEYLTDREADEATAFLREHADRPFFLEVAHYAVHTPIQAPPDRVEAWQKIETTHQRNPRYAAMIERVDQAVGRVMDTLEELKIGDRTLVVFTSDNGGLLPITSNEPLRAGKGFPYEGGLRVPMIARLPGMIPAGAAPSVPISGVDVLPSVCAALEVPLPPPVELDGVDHFSDLTSSSPKDPRALYWHFPHYRGKEIGPYSVVRLGEWKLIRFWEGLRHELYDLEADLGESVDLARDRPDVVARLTRLLDRHLLFTAAKLPRTPVPESAPSYMGREIARTMHWEGSEWLLRETREKEEHGSRLLELLGIQPGWTVCDLGVGSGYHAIPIAGMVGPRGRVLGVDIQPEMLFFLCERARDASLDNIHPILGELHDPRLPESSCDLVLMVDVYHELSHPAEVLQSVRAALRPGGRVALVEFRAEDAAVPIKKRHKMTKVQMRSEFQANGFRVAAEHDGLPWQHVMLFERTDT